MKFDFQKKRIYLCNVERQILLFCRQWNIYNYNLKQLLQWKLQKVF